MIWKINKWFAERSASEIETMCMALILIAERVM